PLVARVVPVQLLFFFAAGQTDLRGIDDHHVIAGVDVRRVDRLVFALQQAGSFRRDAPEDLPLGVDDVPLPLDVASRDPGGAGSGNERTHGILVVFYQVFYQISTGPSQRTANQKDTGN